MINVTAAVFINHSNVAAFRRKAHLKHGGRWEFPGGKIEAGESPEMGMRRELWEELTLEVGEITAMESVIHQYEQFAVQLFGFMIVTPITSFSLTDHSEMRWLTKNEAYSVDWLEADLPLLQQVLSLLD